MEKELFEGDDYWFVSIDDYSIGEDTIIEYSNYENDSIYFKKFF